MNRALVIFCSMLLIGGCDRPKPRAIAPLTKPVVAFDALTQIRPNSIVHPVVDSLGNVMYTCETEGGSDGAIALSETGIPRATRLISANILAALGESPGGTGTIQSLARGADGVIWFYFIGGKGRTLDACVGQYQLRTDAIVVAFDTDRLRKSSTMGDSLGLARGSIVAVGEWVYLLLRHTDRWVIFRFPNRQISRAEALDLEQPFSTVSDGEESLNLTRDRYRLAPGADQLLLMDTQDQTIWSLDLTGHATMKALVSGLRSGLSAPAPLDKNRLLLFAADAPGDATLVGSSRSLAQVNFPAMLTLTIATENGMPQMKMTAVGRDDFRVYQGFPAYAMRIDQLVPAKDGEFIGYDSASGQLMRVRLTSEEQ